MKVRHATASCLVALAAFVAAAPAVAQGRYQVSADGREVNDATTHLTWQRCVEGQQWNGKACEGKPLKFTYHEARRRAADVARSGGAWRLPTRDELAGLVSRGKKKPLIDTAAFPNTPSQQFWATRPGSEDDLNAWLVSFSNGRVYGNVGQARFPLRLVRDPR